MSKDGVVPPQGGPSRRPAGGPVNHTGTDRPQGPEGRRYGAQQGHATSRYSSEPPGAGRSAKGDPAARWTDEPTGDVPGDAAGWHGDGAEPDAAQRAALSEGLLSAAELDLARALRTRVAVVGVSGPPPGGLTRIRRKAHTRQRNRVVLAGSAGVLMLAMAVTMATGDRFDLVPTLTGAVGLGGGSRPDSHGGANGSSTAAVAGDGSRAVWPTGTGGHTGLAIGPVGPVLTTPSAAAAAKLPMCTAATLKTTTTVGPSVHGTVYGRIDAVARDSCVVVGPPVLTVANEAGTAGSSVVILKEDPAAAPLLPVVPTWGTAMALKAGQGYQFQFAWNAVACSQSSASPAPSATQAANSTYYLGYAVTGTTPTAVVAMTASCGAQVYVTDIYAPGAYPVPKVTASPPPASSSPAPAPPSSPAAPTTTSSSPAPPDSPSASPASPSAAPNPGSGSGGGGGSGGVNATTPSG